MDIEQLRRFVEVGQCLNFTKAADALFITQPTLSHTIAQMEKELGAELFYRVKKTVCLTPVGEAFLPHAIDIVKRYESAINAVEDRLKEKECVLSIGVFGVGLDNGISFWLRRFQEKYPNTKIRLHRYSTNEFTQVFRRTEHDVFLMYDLNADFEDLYVKKLYSERFELLVNKNHPLSEAERIDLACLGNEPLLLRSREHSLFYHDRVMDICKNRNYCPVVIDVDGSYGMIHRMVSEGHGMAILSHYPSTSRVSDVYNVKYVCIDDRDDLDNDVLFAWRGKLSPNGEKFLHIIETTSI